MSIHSITASSRLYPSESSMPGSPRVCLTNGRMVVPQHYLQFHQTVGSLEALIQDIDCLPLMPIFASEDKYGMFVQVGMVGRENYDRSNSIRPQKLVYGRKWRIDHDTPTSEVIQTVFLAIKKACEHEVRELLTLKEATTGKVSTPFSTHHDLPLMSSNQDLINNKPSSTYRLGDIEHMLGSILFEQRKIIIDHVWSHPKKADHIIIDLRLGQAPLARQQEKDILEFDHFECSLMLSSFNPIHFLHALMDEFIRYSDHIVAESFRYQDFLRFSKDNDPHAIAALSIATRPYKRDMKDEAFANTFKQLNDATDALRAPHLGSGALADKNRRIISQVKHLTGHMPKGFTPYL